MVSRLSRISGLMVCASVAALMATAASAQSSGGAADPAPAAPQASADTVGEIVVTAQKRAERLESVPIAITSVSGDTLTSSNVGVSSQLPQLVPALRIDYSGAFAQPTIRGVGSAVAGNGLGANVATYIDGFYVPSALSNDFQLLSVTNVSVLKGPQGTLFGRNATGGAIQVTTKDPSFDTTVIASGSYARFNHGTVSAYASTGLTEKLAVDIAGIYEHSNGFTRNIVTGKHANEFEKWTVRSKALLELDDTTRFTLTYAHNVIHDPTPQIGSLHVDPVTGRALGVAAVIPGAVYSTQRGIITEDNPSHFNLKVDSISLKGDKDLGFANLISYTQYRWQNTDQAADYDHSSIPIFFYDFFYKQRSFSQELNLISKDAGRFKWTIGANYFHDVDQQTDFLISLGGGPLFQGYQTYVKTDAGAVFADATYEVIDHLFLTGGFRYTIEHKEASYLTQSAAVGVVGGAANKKTWRSGTPRAVIRYEITPRTSVYASFSQGFKSGAFNASGQNVSDPVNPEKIDAYEIGFKTASRLLRFDTSAYYYNYRQLQIASYLNSSSFLRNAASSHIYGADANLVLTPDPHWTFRVAGAYTHARFQQFQNAPFYAQCLNVTACGAGYGTFVPSGIDASGFRMPRTPTWTGSFGAQYATPLAGGKLTLNADYYITSKVYFDAVQQFYQKGYGLLNLRAAYDLPGDKIQVAVFATNVTDKTYLNQVLPAALSIADTYGEPRSYGVSVRFKY